jgi:hypothetical protein
MTIYTPLALIIDMSVRIRIQLARCEFINRINCFNLLLNALTRDAMCRTAVIKFKNPEL